MIELEPEPELVDCGNCGGVFHADEVECPGCGWPLGGHSEEQGDVI